jgi:hypothetical protein
MDKLIAGLGPAFAAGFAVQQLFEILDPLLGKIAADRKKVVLGVLSLIIGLFLSVTLNLRVLSALGVETSGFGATVDVVVTGLIISAGTEGVNSILKFLGYAKDKKKNGG